MQEAKTAIKVRGISKNFVLPHEKITSLKGVFTDLLRSKSSSQEVQHALREINFEVKKGEFFGIVGKNGSGKSTLLKMLAGIYQPSQGKITTEGKLVPFIELGVGFNPELTGKENVYLNGAMLGFSRRQITAMYKDIVSFAELERFMDQKLKNYSSGMQVRLAFSMATRSEADILLVDEVLAVGDAAFQRKCFEYFRELKKNKKTVVFVSHDMSAIREYCDRAVLIDEAKLVQTGSAEEIAKAYTKLFASPASEGDSSTKQASKWGSGGLDITKVTTLKKRYKEEDETIDIQVTVVARRTFENGVIAGITVKNEAGQPVCGTNTKIIRMENVSLTKGQPTVIVWAVPNIFNEGRFTIEPALLDGVTQEVCQWWNDARSFHVENEQKTPYVVAPRITLAVGAPGS